MQYLPNPDGEKYLFDLKPNDNIQVGDKHVQTFAAPWVGKITWRITKIQEGKVYGEYESGWVAELDIEDCI